ncbi:MAG: YihA family ribosome biogenesis GTP-binding protein [Nitrospinae bacterium CG11_big_fil_rev_8_21_14_0_20_56_8]|nr:MAG: YihA family ribosome biogenesis GTP-binding protein [Nitrospinae bacterium CG11_big_fil_rev_8_21_14_0_20_56_8]
MKIVSAEFVASAVSPNQYPGTEFPEFAFVGRSNVGKSSLINSLLNRKKLVKTSSTPGKTQTINFFRVNANLMFADLPGYGFAKVPDAVRKHWRGMIEKYLLGRNTLRAVVFIVDIRRKPSQLDLDLKDWLEGNRIPYILVITKSDKLSAGEKSKQVKLIGNILAGSHGGHRVVYSSNNSEGRKLLWSHLVQLAGEQKNSPDPRHGGTEES